MTGGIKSLDSKLSKRRKTKWRKKQKEVGSRRRYSRKLAEEEKDEEREDEKVRKWEAHYLEPGFQCLFPCFLSSTRAWKWSQVSASFFQAHIHFSIIHPLFFHRGFTYLQLNKEHQVLQKQNKSLGVIAFGRLSRYYQNIPHVISQSFPQCENPCILLHSSAGLPLFIILATVDVV